MANTNLDSKSRPTDLIVVTCYFNPQSYHSRRVNYERFASALQDRGIPLLTIECALGERPFELSDGPASIRVRAQSVLWHKERLINIAIKKASLSFTKIAWVDADVLFEDPSWFWRASEALETWPVIQLFDEVVRLPRNTQSYSSEHPSWTSFAARSQRSPGCHLHGWFRHGHTGYAWAASREVLQNGLYEMCISGGNDHLMAHAFVGDWHSRCIDGLVGLGSALHISFRRWARSIQDYTRGRLGYVDGRILHLWHGEDRNRTYYAWSEQLKNLRLRPDTDLCSNESGCLEWTGLNPKAQQWSSLLFASRREDGETASAGG